MLIANCKGVGEGVVKGKIVAIIIAHGQRHARTFLMARSLGIQPTVMIAMVAGVGLVRPRMRQRSQPGSFRAFEIQPEGGISFARGIGLQPHRFLIRQSNGAWIVESANAAQGSEGVIERAILLHQNDNVLRIQKRTALRRIDGRCPLNRSQKDAANHSSPAGESGRVPEKVSARTHLRNYHLSRSRLLVPQRERRIDAQGAACGQIAGQQGHRAQDNGDGGEDHRVRWLDVEEQRG